MKWRKSLLGGIVEAAANTSSYSSATIKTAWQKVIPKKQQKSRYECQYCFENKREHEFVSTATVPYSCRHHLSLTNRVCKTCMESSLRAQLDSKPILEVGCPQCGEAWDLDELQFLVGVKNQKRLRYLDRLARDRVLVPADLPDGATVDMLLSKGARFW